MDYQFQSTLPAGEATLDGVSINIHATDFNPRFPRGKRHNSLQPQRPLRQISIHASRGGSDEFP